MSDNRQAVRICVFVAALDGDGRDLDRRVSKAIDKAILSFREQGLDLMYDEEASGPLDKLYGPIDEVEARLSALEEADANRCRVCGEPNDDGEGWDSMCGNCADRAES